MINEAPRIHGFITPEQAAGLSASESHEAVARLAELGVHDSGPNSLFAVKAQGGDAVDSYVVADPNDIGTVLRAHTEQQLGLPESNRSRARREEQQGQV